MGNEKIFVDSSVLVAAFLSSSGASYFCIIFTPEAGYKLLINEMVFEETLDVLKRIFQKRSYKFCEGSQTDYFTPKRVYSISETKNKKMRIYNYARSPNKFYRIIMLVCLLTSSKKLMLMSDVNKSPLGQT
jgi:predicted nucleic acid-binding protein